jgi:very-short-patch-repair endonuclease
VLGLPLGSNQGTDRTRSELEVLFLELCRRHDLPSPEVNVRVGPFTVDFLWRDRGLVVETDGYRYHRGRTAFEEDRDRDLRLRSLGYDVLRLSYAQVTREQRRVISAVRSAL